MIHGLGFSNTLYGSFFDSNTGYKYPKTTFMRNNVLYLSTPRVLNYTRYYFGCDSADGIPVNFKKLNKIDGK